MGHGARRLDSVYLDLHFALLSTSVCRSPWQPLTRLKISLMSRAILSRSLMMLLVH